MKKDNHNIWILSLLCLFSVCLMIASLCVNKKDRAEFIPPQSDKTVKQGIPPIDETEPFGWSEIYHEGMTYKTAICGNIQVINQEAYVYLTNYESNNVWLKLRVIDSGGNVIAETGLAKQGEYIEKIEFNRKMIDGEKIQLKIMAYEPETYYSAGTVALNTKIKRGE